MSMLFDRLLENLCVIDLNTIQELIRIYFLFRDSIVLNGKLEIPNFDFFSNSV